MLEEKAPSVPAAAALRRELAARLPGAAADLDVLHLVCGEFLANAKEHGGGLQGIRVGRTARPGTLRVEVDDSNPAEPVVKPKDVDAITGRGMFLVDNLALAWGCTPNGTGKTVWAVVPCGDAAA
ncbi:hypothetical protein BJP25_21770 [Actinokineospora bangkokensis]|uniref:Histidine kinase/HSP90-like ATPase domain-containing protein n=1 Tax=Actinokineospora bangkokensis TaxID=1193682 RepID=A0A1Q9LL47_9PSEU|nr:hypothetical protein BJP25_21770 [Actinokineospora bangkokensis]